MKSFFYNLLGSSMMDMVDIIVMGQCYTLTCTVLFCHRSLQYWSYSMALGKFHGLWGKFFKVMISVTIFNGNHTVYMTARYTGTCKSGCQVDLHCIWCNSIQNLHPENTFGLGKFPRNVLENFTRAIQYEQY